MTPIQQYTAAVFDAEEGGFWAEILELPGCVAQGETIAELQAALPVAIEVWEETAREIAAEDSASAPVSYRNVRTMSILREASGDYAIDSPGAPHS